MNNTIPKSLDEALQIIKSSVILERELERNLFQEEKSNLKNNIKGLSVEDHLYITGDIWRISLSVSGTITHKSWLRQGVPALLEKEDFSLVVQVYQVKEKYIVLQYKGEIEVPEENSFTLSPWYSESTYDAYLEAIDTLIQKKDKRARDLLSWILGFHKNEKPSPPKLKNIISYSEKLLDINDYCFLYGPPGTGKTTVLAESIQKWKAQGKSILALAPTNFATDYLVEKTASMGLRPLRLGNSAKIKESVHDYLLDTALEESEEQKQINIWRKEWQNLKKKAFAWKRNFGAEEREERKQLQKEAKELIKLIGSSQKRVKERIIANADLVVSTFLGAWNFFEEGKKFDIVVVDESTQAWESACYMAILMGETIIFAGDPKQLPPTFLDADTSQTKSFLEKGIEGDDGTRTVFLETQYRMHNDILTFSNREFYDSKVITSDTLSPSESSNIKSVLGSDKNIFWIDTAGSDASEETGEEDESTYNTTEADLILELLKNDINKSSIAILSPYRAQIDLIKEKINKEFTNMANLPLVQTIDSFQGREADTIILSFVRTNEEGEIGFLKDYRRLNVGLTRAKSTLILVGDSVTLSSDKVYSRLFETVQIIGEHRTIFEFLY
ncbi:AAA domain-containing protein [Leptospira ilyithenensis]|uniref:RNA helicase n=1 Tax=Leptospira ilyithenensis TaxID=2484901 RepID=A0A4V3JX77_9LEPT|nr:AAA domain-containing protein [Leptospira ilyithenensis]TGN11957.1 RNA helicase [Leptospira ilyithenensis]